MAKRSRVRVHYGERKEREHGGLKPSSETQGQFVGWGETGQPKFSSAGVWLPDTG